MSEPMLIGSYRDGGDNMTAEPAPVCSRFVA
jgi:hypothetical protein